MAALISSKVWFLFIALTEVVVVGSPTTDLLESVDCLLRDCVRINSRMLTETTIDSVRNERLTGQKHDSYARVIMWNMTLRVCLNRSVFLLFSLSCELSPFFLHEHVLSLLVSKLFIRRSPSIHSINSMFLVLYSHT